MKEKSDWVDAIRLTISSSEGNNKINGLSSNNSDRRSFISPDNSGSQRNTIQLNSNNNTTQSQSSFVLFDLTSEKAIIRVYLADNSCKTLSIKVHDTVQDIINLMKKKLGGNNYDNFVIFEIRDIVSFKLDENVKISEIFSRWPKNATYHTHRLVFQPEDSEQLKEASKVGLLEVKTNANKYSSSSIQELNSSHGLKRKITETLKKKSKKKGMVMLRDIKVFQKSGYIHKKNSAKYFILHDGILYYFDNNKPDTMSSGIINLSTSTLFTGKGLSFTIYYTGEDKMKEFEAHCKTMDEKQIWLDTLLPLCNVVTNTPVKNKEESTQKENNSNTNNNDQIQNQSESNINTPTEVTNSTTDQITDSNTTVQPENTPEEKVNTEPTTSNEELKNEPIATSKMTSNLPQLNTDFDHSIPHDHSSVQLRTPFMKKYSMPFSKMGISPLSPTYAPTSSPFSNPPNTASQTSLDGKIEEEKENEIEFDINDIDKMLEEAHSALDDTQDVPQTSESTSVDVNTQSEDIKLNHSNPIDITRNVLPNKIEIHSPSSQSGSPYITPHSNISNTPQFDSPDTKAQHDSLSTSLQSSISITSQFGSPFTTSNNVTLQYGSPSITITQNSQSNTPTSYELSNTSLCDSPQISTKLTFNSSNTPQYGSPLTSNLYDSPQPSYSSSPLSINESISQHKESQAPLSDHVILDIMDILNGNMASPFDDDFMFPSDIEPQKNTINLLDGEFYFEDAD